MTEKPDLKEKLQTPAQLQTGGPTESYSKLEAAVLAWRRLLPDDKATAIIWCDGEIFEHADIEALDADLREMQGVVTDGGAAGL